MVRRSLAMLVVLISVAALGAQSTLPPDIHPESLNRLPPVQRESLDEEGKRIWDSIAGGRGMPRIDGPGRGDLVAHLKLIVPSAMSAEEEAHLRKYAEAGGQRVSPERGGFFRKKKKK